MTRGVAAYEGSYEAPRAAALAGVPVSTIAPPMTWPVTGSWPMMPAVNPKPPSMTRWENGELEAKSLRLKWWRMGTILAAADSYGCKSTFPFEPNAVASSMARVNSPSGKLACTFVRIAPSLMSPKAVAKAS